VRLPEAGPETSNRPSREFRYERKFLADQLDTHQVRALVKAHPSMFYEPYPPRYVNNLYLDTKGLENYFANVAGAEEREKVRVRWYGDLFRFVEWPVLEFKIKCGLMSTKFQYRFPPFRLDRQFSGRAFRDALRKLNHPNPSGGTLQDLDVVLLNRYYRWYYATRDNQYRITVDTGLTYYRVTRMANSFAHKQVEHRQVIVEMKYGRECEETADRISSFFPFRVTKNSKYVTGIDRVFF
jgi:hypothetical protein